MSDAQKAKLEAEGKEKERVKKREEVMKERAKKASGRGKVAARKAFARVAYPA